MMYYYNYWNYSLMSSQKFSKNDNFKIKNYGFCFISNRMFQKNGLSHAEAPES